MPRNSVDDRIQTICLLTITIMATGAALYWLRPVMIPFVLALLLAYVLGPIQDALGEYARAPRWLALTVTLVLGFVVLSATALLVSGSVKQLASSSASYQAHITEMVGQVAAHLREWDVHLGADEFEQQLSKLPVGSWLVKATNAVVDVVSNTFVVLVFVVYLLDGRRRSDRSSPIWEECDRQIKRYVNIKIALSAMTGVLVGVILWLIGVELAIVFGVLAFVLNFIPSVGSVIATLLPIPLIIVSPDFSGTTLALATVLPGTVQMVVGNVIEPKLLGESLDLHPVTVLLALILWGMLWGIAGMLLAAPMTAVAKILMANLEYTRPVSELMAGRFGTPKSHPVEEQP